MKRYKKLAVLLGVLIVACCVTLGVMRYEERQEDIKESGDVVLEIDPDTVTTLSWKNEYADLSFQKDGDTWSYDDDSAFPVDSALITERLELFEAFSAAFIIENVEDFGQYGLDDPVCTICVTTADKTWEITLGDYSTMDSQRYVSIGDGNVYLVKDDPLDLYDAVLRDMIDQDEAPVFSEVSSIQFSGTENYSIDYSEDSGSSWRADDVYFTRRSGSTLPLDTDRVSSYLDTVSYLDLTNYVTYNASDEDLAGYGLDEPELTVTVDYAATDEDGNESAETFTLHISRDPAELADADTADGAASSESGSEDEEEEEITAYARVGDSPIVYQIEGDDYQDLMAASQNDLRHREILPADTADITQADITLEGKSYTVTASGEEDERVWSYGDTELEDSDLDSALAGLTVTDAADFTDVQPSGKEEISLTIHIDADGSPASHISFYRYDGSKCLAVVDGESVALVPRSTVVDLIEAVNAVVLS